MKLRMPATSANIFLLLTAFFIAIGLIYGFTSDWEPAGAALLFGSAGLSIITAVFIDYAIHRGMREEMSQEEYEQDVMYLPHASIWPFGVGTGVSLMAAGMAAGIWLIVPGVVIFGYSIVGFIAQTRHRS